MTKRFVLRVMSRLVESYATASIVSCVTAVGLGRAVETAKSLSPGVRSALRKVP